MRAIAGPAAVGLLFSTLYNVADTWFAGLVSTDAQAGLSVAFSVFMLMIAAGFGLSQGLNGLIGNALGAGDPERARRTGLQGLVFTGLFSIALGAAGWVAAPGILAAMGAEAAVAAPATSYARIMLIAAPAFLLTFAANGCLSAQGDSRAMQRAQVVGFFANLGLNPLLMFGAFGLPGFGFEGIALATLAIQSAIALFMLRRALASDALRRSGPGGFAMDRAVIRDILLQSAPASVTMLVMTCGIFVIQTFLQPFGAAAVAGYGVAFRVEQLLLLPALGVTSALLPLVGQNFGAGAHDRVRQSMTLGLVVCAGMMAVGAAALLLFGRAAIALFNDDPAVIDAGCAYLSRAAFMLHAYTAMFALTNMLQGLKRPVWSIWIGLWRQVFGLALFIWIGVHGLDLGLAGLWWGLLASVWSGCALSFVIAIHVARRSIGGFRPDFAALRPA